MKEISGKGVRLRRALSLCGRRLYEGKLQFREKVSRNTLNKCVLFFLGGGGGGGRGGGVKKRS